MNRDSSDTAGADIFVVLNPASGSCDTERIRQSLERECASVNMHCAIHEAKANDDLRTIVRQARGRGYRRVVAAGGDGTVSAVIAGLLYSGIPLAVLPVGTANLAARELHIPLQCEAACRLAARGRHTREIDAMQVGDRAFLSHISLGVYSRIAEKTSATAKRYFRPIAYAWHALSDLMGGRAWWFDLIVDGRKYRFRASLIMIANIGGVGASTLRWGPDIRPDDGQIDICIVQARTLRDYLLLAWHILRHQHRRSPHASYLYARRYIEVSTDKPLPVRGGGEIIGRSRVYVEVLPKAIRVVVPEGGEQRGLSESSR